MICLRRQKPCGSFDRVVVGNEVSATGIRGHADILEDERAQQKRLLVAEWVKIGTQTRLLTEHAEAVLQVDGRSVDLDQWRSRNGLPDEAYVSSLVGGNIGEQVAKP